MDTTTNDVETPEGERRRLLAAHAELERAGKGHGANLDDLPQINDDLERIRTRLVQLGALTAPPVRTVTLHSGPLRGRTLEQVARGAFAVEAELPAEYAGPQRAAYRADPRDPDRWQWTGLVHPEEFPAFAGTVERLLYHRWEAPAERA